MLIELVQRDCNGTDKTVDIADSIEKLDFSGLRGSAPWAVWVIWDDRQDCIARVAWEASGAYQVFESGDGGACPAQVTFRQDCIVPDVKRRLRGLFQRGLIDRVYRRQPYVLVTPLG